ncbi:hypothetical protein J2W42_002032 [Rhizobium tibeticum]|nr:hypothetical protein [Rhizobium tibeticum]MDP9809184.1 hypothetical protein [Rhizobium tibeticum]
MRNTEKLANSIDELLPWDTASFARVESLLRPPEFAGKLAL